MGRAHAPGIMLAWSQAKAPTEEQIHRALVLRLQLCAGPGVVWWHTPNGDIRHAGAAGRLKAMGTIPGVPDLLFLRDGQLYGLELKRAGGRPSVAQSEFQSRMAAAGAIVATVDGLEAAVTTMRAWGVLR